MDGWLGVVIMIALGVGFAALMIGLRSPWASQPDSRKARAARSAGCPPLATRVSASR